MSPVVPLSRRQFLSTTVAGSVSLSLPPAWSAPRRPRIAALTTIYHKYSHSQHIVDRFLEGYGWEGRHHRPEMDVVSLYVEQVGDNDLSRERASRHPEMKIYPTIAEALCQGGSQLAVDGVLLIGEHGQYPRNDRGQILYPRYEYFQQIVDVYRASGKTAPVFNDKHLSWNWDWARKMYDQSRELGFSLMAGSSLPVTWRQPAHELPEKARVREAVGIWGGGIDGGDIHVIEALQSIVERREGGERGVQSVEALHGDRFWQALEAGSWEAGGWDRQLLEACFARSNQLRPARDSYSHVLPKPEDIRRLAPESYAYRFVYRDGLRVSIVQFQPKPKQTDGGVVGDCSMATRMEDGSEYSVLFYLPYYSMRNFFSPQVHHIERMFQTGAAPYPVERTLLTTGMTAAGVESLFQKKPLPTPHLAIEYQPTPQSTFWRR